LLLNSFELVLIFLLGETEGSCGDTFARGIAKSTVRQ
jgi:hypothetical protein